MKIINPATEQVISEVREEGQAETRAKHGAAVRAQRQWASAPVSARLDVLRRFQALLGEQKDRLAHTLTEEVGKPIVQSRNELDGAYNRMQFMLDSGDRWLREETMLEEPGLVEKIRYEPLGVVANISAWNYPYLVGINVFVPALLTGNAVLYKPSEYSSLTGAHMMRLFREAGLPEGLFTSVYGGAAAGEHLIDLRLPGYFFTGSHRTGQYIYKRVAEFMAVCQMELGGKDPLYVADDIADVEETAAAVAEGAFYNNGQSCCAVERVYVHRRVYEEFLAAFVAEVQSYKIGDPFDEATFIGPLTRVDQAEVLERQVKEAQAKGGRLLLGGGRLQRKGYYFEPTVIADCNHEMGLMREESFGPVVGIQPVENDAEAVERMQDTLFGLTAAVYSEDADRAEAILKQMDTGTVYWNCCDRVSGNLPWSGRKQSGFGATLSYHGIRAFLRPKSYHLKRG